MGHESLNWPNHTHGTHGLILGSRCHRIVPMQTKVSADPVEKPDFIARYFLRRLAMAHRASPNRKLSIQYNSAFADTIFLVVCLPMIAFVSVVGLSSLRWAPQIATNGPHISRLSLGLVLWTLSVLIGYLWLRPRLKKYKDDRSAFTEFASARDARIASWQRHIAFIVCAIVLPLLTLFVISHI